MKLGMIFAFSALAISSVAGAGPVLPRTVSEIFSYACTFRFPEGEGVSSDSISCLPGQHLGLYEADYRFYLFRNDYGSNFPSRGTAQPFPAPVCGVSLDRYSCEAVEPRLEFGLSARSEGVFNVAVSLVPAPFAGGSIMGFAARLNSQGMCPEGLVKIRPYFAYPPSMVSPLPSTFINLNGVLNSIQVSATRPEPFPITRIPAKEPCDSKGRCSAPQGELYVAEVAPYSAASPVVCAVPASAIQR